MANRGKKNFFSFSEFDELGDAMDLFAQTIKSAWKYDVFDGKNTFDAVVLTQPVPMNVAQIKAFLPSSPPPEGPAASARNLLNIDDDELPKFMFKAQIVGEHSPHLFRPDICDPEVVKKLESQQQIQDVYDSFITVIAKKASEKPEIGNIVKIRLEPGTYKYDLQLADFVEVASKESNSVANILAARTSECAETAADTFGSFMGITVGDNTTQRGVSYTKHFDPNGPRLMIPAIGRITSRFGTRIHPITKRRGFHSGIDIGNVEGSKIVAAFDGRVKSVFTNAKEPQKGDNGGAGNYMEIEHNIGGQKYLTRYLHLLHTNSDKKDSNAKIDGIVYVDIGETVKKGQVIALMGNTGGSTGPHLHFDLRKGTTWNKNPLDPEKHFEDNFDESLRLLEEERTTGILQADSDSINPPQETEERIEAVETAENNSSSEDPSIPSKE